MNGCSTGDRVQFQRLKCTVSETEGFRSPSCSAQNPCREIVQREETAASARRWHRSGQKVAAMACQCHAEQSEADALSVRPDGTEPGCRGHGPPSPHHPGCWSSRRPLVSQAGGTGARTWARQLGASGQREQELAIYLSLSSPIAMSRCLAVVHVLVGEWPTVRVDGCCPVSPHLLSAKLHAEGTANTPV